MMRPRVTILMPVHNGGKYLVQAVESIQRQSLEDFEFIIIDDGSTDETPRLLCHAARADSRLRILMCGSIGISSALEAGRAVAGGHYIARMDADDVALPNRLALQADYLDANPGIVAVGGQVRNIDEFGSPLSRGRFPTEPRACRAYLAFGVPHCHPAMMLRRDALDLVGGYRRIFEPAEDLDLWLRLSTIGELANLDVEVLKYRRHAAAVTVRRATANARAACLARLAQSLGETVVPVNWNKLHSGDAGWSTIETALPPHVRLEARASYLQALTLNGGISEPHAWALLRSSMPELAQWSRREASTDKLAFMIVRAVYQMARSNERSRSVIACWLGLRYAPMATFKEAVASLRARFAAEHVSRCYKSSSEGS